MTTPITTTTQLEAPDPSPTVLALAQALATVDGKGSVFTSTTRSETSAAIVSVYIRAAESIAKHLPASQAPECDHAALVRNLAQSTVLSLASAEAVVHAATTWTAPAPTVKPGRDEVLEAVLGARWPSGDRIDGVTARTAALIADAVLAIQPGKTEAQVRAEALRDAKARIALDFTFSGHEVAAWLDALADEEAGK